MSGYRHRALGTLLDGLRKGLVGGLIRLLSEWPPALIREPFLREEERERRENCRDRPVRIGTRADAVDR